LMQPAGDDRVHHKAVVGVVGADGIEAQPSAFGILDEARLTAIIGAVQGFEARQRARRLAHVGGLGGGNPRQPGLAQPAELAHAQAQARVAGELDGRMAQAHVARDRQARTRLGEARWVESVLQQ